MTLAKGIHQCAIYLGHSHFIVKSLPFLIEGLQQNAKCYLCAEDTLYEKMIYALEKNYGRPRPGSICRTPLEDWNELHRSGGKLGLRRGLVRCLEEAFQEGYSQMRQIGQILHEITVTGASLDTFLRLEHDYHRASANLPIHTLCMYDVAIPVELHDLTGCHHSWASDRQAPPDSHPHFMPDLRKLN